MTKYDTTIAQIAGNVLSGRTWPSEAAERDVLAEQAVALARTIVAETRRRERDDALRSALAPRPPIMAVAAVQALVDRLEHEYAFECAGGPLRNCTEWIDLKRICLSHPPPTPEEPAK